MAARFRFLDKVVVPLIVCICFIYAWQYFCLIAIAQPLVILVLGQEGFQPLQTVVALATKLKQSLLTVHFKRHYCSLSINR